jgi:hypothetical protein
LRSSPRKHSALAAGLTDHHLRELADRCGIRRDLDG